MGRADTMRALRVGCDMGRASAMTAPRVQYRTKTNRFFEQLFVYNFSIYINFGIFHFNIGGVNPPRGKILENFHFNTFNRESRFSHFILLYL